MILDKVLLELLNRYLKIIKTIRDLNAFLVGRRVLKSTGGIRQRDYCSVRNSTLIP